MASFCVLHKASILVTMFLTLTVTLVLTKIICFSERLTCPSKSLAALLFDDHLSNVSNRVGALIFFSMVVIVSFILAGLFILFNGKRLTMIIFEMFLVLHLSICLSMLIVFLIDYRFDIFLDWLSVALFVWNVVVVGMRNDHFFLRLTLFVFM